MNSSALITGPAGSARTNPATSSRSQLTVAPRRRQARSPNGACVCMSAFGSASAAFDAGSSGAMITQLATGAAWVAAAWMGVQLFLQQGQQRSEGAVECETCHGSGVVDCLVCTRWSDSSSDSSGCGACAGSRKMACTSCNGGGTAVPIEAKVYIKRESDYFGK